MTTTLTASTTAKLNQDIATVDAATSGDFIIDLQGNITETANLKAINLQSGVQLTISGTGGSSTLDGGGSFGLVVDAGSVTIENLDISNAVLSGGPIPDTVALSDDIFSGTVAIANKLTIDEVAPVTLGNTHGPATVINQAGSTYDVDVVGDAIDQGPAGVSHFVNKGTLAQTGLIVGASEIHVDVTDTGTLSVAGGSNLRFFGANNSFSGTYVGGGMIDYWDGSTDALGTIDMTSGACTTVEDATVNQGGVVTLSTSTTITVATGTWNFTSDNGLVAVDPGASGAAFNLDGALAKTGGTGTTVIGCDFNGNGAATINVASGTLAFNGLSNNFSDAISGAGTFSIGGGGADAIDTGTTINTRGWTITDADTDVTLNAALTYSGTFREQSGATLTLTPSNNLTLTNSASFTDATINGSGTLTLAGAKATMNGGTIGAGVTIELLSGTLSESGIVTNSGTLFASGGTVLIAGTANGITVGVGGKEIVQSGGTAIGTTILAGGTVTVSSGGTFEFTSGATGMPIVLAGATLEIGSGYVFSGTINSGVRLEILSGGTDSGATVNSGGREIVLAGGTASNTTVLKGGIETVSSGGSASDTTVSSGGTLDVLSGGSADPTTIYSGGREIVSGQGTDDGAVISGGKQLVYGVASGATVFSGTQMIEAGGTASSTIVSGGTVIVSSGGTAIDPTINTGGTLSNALGGTVIAQTAATDAGTLINSGAVVVANGATLALLGVVVGNAGHISLSGTTDSTELSVSGTVSLTGGGKVLLTPSEQDSIVAVSSGATLSNVNNVISGAGFIGAVNDGLNFVNNGTVIGGIGSGTLFINTGATPVINGGTLEGVTSGQGNQGGLVFNSSVVSNTAAGTILASGSNAIVGLFDAVVSGGTLKTSGAGAVIETQGTGATLANVTNNGVFQVIANDTLQLQSGTFTNNGTVRVINNGAAVDIDQNVTLAGSGSIDLIGFANILPLGATATLINKSTISGTGTIGDNGLTLVNSGTIVGNTTSALTITTSSTNTDTNAGTLESTKSDGLAVEANFTNSKTFEAIGTNAQLFIEGDLANHVTINNVGASATILASGSGAAVFLSFAVVSGGTLKTSGAGAAIETEAGIGGTDAIIGATIAASTLIEATSGTTLTISGGKVGVAAIVETTIGGTAIVSGTLTNSGTLFASGSGSLLEIANGAVVNGGFAKVGNGIVDIEGASSENVTFQAGGSGGLELADPTAYTGKVSGFGVSGGISHADHTQYIDLTSVTFAAGLISASYMSANASNTSGTLMVSSGGTVVADITLVGTYTSANFHVGSGAGGTVEITDPSVVEQPSGNAPATIAGGSVLEINTPDSGKVTFGGSGGTLQLDQPATFAGTVAGFATPDSIDLPGIGFGATTTLAFSENNSRTGGTLTVTDGTHTAAIALLGNYMASTFNASNDGFNGTSIVDPHVSASVASLTQTHKG